MPVFRFSRLSSSIINLMLIRRDLQRYRNRAIYPPIFFRSFKDPPNTSLEWNLKSGQQNQVENVWGAEGNRA